MTQQSLHRHTWAVVVGVAGCGALAFTACLSSNNAGPGPSLDSGGSPDGGVPFESGAGDAPSEVGAAEGAAAEGSAAEAGSANLGRVWHEIEEAGNCNGVWTRQGSTSTFTSVWANCGGTTATLTISIVGTRVTVARAADSGGNGCTYLGTLSADALSVTGTYSCTLYNPPPPGAWSATIDYGAGDAGADAAGDATAPDADLDGAVDAPAG